jgi:hypothetical protein
MKNEEIDPLSKDYVVSRTTVQKIDHQTGEETIELHDAVYRPTNLQEDEIESTFM